MRRSASILVHVLLNTASFTPEEKAAGLLGFADGKFRVLRTFDAGKSWKVLPNTGMPDALKGEGAFAASGAPQSPQNRLPDGFSASHF